jgi:hypothetical protein
MRSPSGGFAAAAVYPTSWAADDIGVHELQPHLSTEDASRLALERAMREFEAARPDAPSPANSWNFTAVPAETAEVHDETFDEDQDDAAEQELAARLSRTLNHRPLMNRLARVEAAYNEAPRPPEPPIIASVPPPLPQETSQSVAEAQVDAQAALRPIDDLMHEFGDEPIELPETSTAWVGNAQRERGRNHIHNIAAWFATAAIGCSVVGIVVLMLRV